MRIVQTDTKYFSYMHSFAMVIIEQIVLEMVKVPHNGKLQDRKPVRWSFFISLFVLIHTVKAIRTTGAPSQDLPQVKVKIINVNSQITELLLAKCKWTMLIILEHGNRERGVLQTFQGRKTSEKEIFLYDTTENREGFFFCLSITLVDEEKNRKKGIHSWCWSKTNFNYTEIVLVQEELNPIKCDPYCTCHFTQIQGDFLVTKIKITLIILCCKCDFPKGL